MVAGRNIYIYRDGTLAATLPCDTGIIGWRIAPDTPPFTLEPGDVLAWEIDFKESRGEQP